MSLDDATQLSSRSRFCLKSLFWRIGGRCCWRHRISGRAALAAALLRPTTQIFEIAASSSASSSSTSSTTTSPPFPKQIPTGERYDPYGSNCAYHRLSIARLTHTLLGVLGGEKRRASCPPANPDNTHIRSLLWRWDGSRDYRPSGAIARCECPVCEAAFSRRGHSWGLVTFCLVVGLQPGGCVGLGCSFRLAAFLTVLFH